MREGREFEHRANTELKDTMSISKSFLEASDIFVKEVVRMELIYHDVDSSVFATDDEANDKQFQTRHGYCFACLDDYQYFWQLLIEDIDKQILDIRGMIKWLLSPIEISAHGIE